MLFVQQRVFPNIKTINEVFTVQALMCKVCSNVRYHDSITHLCHKYLITAYSQNVCTYVLLLSID